MKFLFIILSCSSLVLGSKMAEFALAPNVEVEEAEEGLERREGAICVAAD